MSDYFKPEVGDIFTGKSLPDSLWIYIVLFNTGKQNIELVYGPDDYRNSHANPINVNNLLYYVLK